MAGSRDLALLRKLFDQRRRVVGGLHETGWLEPGCIVKLHRSVEVEIEGRIDRVVREAG